MVNGIQNLSWDENSEWNSLEALSSVDISVLDQRLLNIRKEIDLIKSWGYGEINFDAIFKWANIIHEFHKEFGENPQGLNILDIGGGLGPLDLYFTKFGRVTNIDLSFERTWFPTTSNGILLGAKGPEYHPVNLRRIEGDFRETITKISEQFTFIYDSCSIIHLSRSRRTKRINYSGNSDISIQEVFSLIKNKLGSDSIFICATDLSNPRSFEFRDMVFENRLLNSAANSGFKIEVVFGENSYNYVLKPFRSVVKGPYQRSLSALTPGSNEIYLMNRWPQTSVIKCQTIVGVFKFSVLNSALPTNFQITSRQKILNLVSRLSYQVINPIQMSKKLKKRLFIRTHDSSNY